MIAVEMDTQAHPWGRCVQTSPVAVPIAERVVNPHQLSDGETEHPSDQLGARRRKPQRIFRGQLATVVAMPERPVGPGPFGFGRPDQFGLGPIVDDDVPERLFTDWSLKSGVGRVT